MENTDIYPPLLSCDEMLDLGLSPSQFLIDIEDMHGFEIVWKLTKNFGGKYVWFRSNDWMNSPFAKVMGVEFTKELYDAGYGPGEFKIPMGPFNSLALRAAKVRTLWDEGLSNREIAHELGITQRSVERRIQKFRELGFIDTVSPRAKALEKRKSDFIAAVQSGVSIEDMAEQFQIRPDSVKARINTLRQSGKL